MISSSWQHYSQLSGEPEQRSVEHSDDIYEGPSQSMGNFKPLASKSEAYSALSNHVLLIGIASFALVLLLGLTALFNDLAR